MWDGVFSPVVRKVTNVPVKLGTADKPVTLKEEPPFGIPDPELLEVWDGGAGIDVGHFIYGNVHYVAVRYDHTNVCFDGEDVPSNDKIYTYVYDENDFADLMYDELGIYPDE